MTVPKRNVLIAGLICNGEKALRRSVEKLFRALAKRAAVSFLVIESDSSDQTVDVLTKLEREYSDFHFVSLGELRSTIPSRTERISFCRNHYLKALRHEKRYSEIEYLAVADLDGINDRITASAVDTCFERMDWDVCTANQNGPYYDVYALRHRIWCPEDWWAKEKFFRTLGVTERERIQAACYALMVHVCPRADWIEVESAFGGLALYRATILRSSKAEYRGFDDKGDGICEHVPFHLSLRADGAKIFINPKFINANYTEHTRQLVGREQAISAFKSLLSVTKHQFKRPFVRRL